MSELFLSLPDLSALTPEQQRVAEAVAAGPRGEVRGPVRLWLHSPELADRAQKLGEFFRLGTTLPQRLCELAILVTARHYGCDYIWFNHSRVALKQGIAPDVIEAIRTARTPRLDDAADQLVYDFVHSVLRGGKVTPPLRTAAIDMLGERGVVELGALVAHYFSGAIVLGLSSVPLPDGSRTCLD
ncbi:carboxymuconolactone decarboxylase family protein [Bosea sp. 117]|uniref:carboxymuconolactone decarboxylase family protein n=1 Tax=Bosea sp. 117 TaxID=1125973 RepID=UPI00056F192E|nr:carboxymuconolactone decarboxylase family protein [Bosea sp. 117]